MVKLWTGRLLTVALGACLCAATAFSQTPATGPWAKVPTLPTTACYTSTDPFVARLDAALKAVQTDRDRQQAINKKIADDYKSIDPMEMASRMQQWMMSNPQEAMKYMQGVQTLGTEEGQAKLMEDPTELARFDNEKKDLIKRYNTALGKAYAPGAAKHAALKKRLGVDPSYPSVKDPGTPAAAMAEENVIMRELDQAYVAFCPTWWVATGPAQSWLKTYKNWLVQEHIPVVDAQEAQVAQTYAIMNTPAASYRSLGTLDSVIKYMDAIGELYGVRRDKPICTPADCGWNY